MVATRLALVHTSTRAEIGRCFSVLQLPRELYLFHAHPWFSWPAAPTAFNPIRVYPQFSGLTVRPDRVLVGMGAAHV